VWCESKRTIICLMGPTASGKTQLAVNLVQRLPYEIISVDSALVYRGMNIGTAKPDQTILQIAPHRLLDIRDPKEAYSAAHFREDALQQISAIHKLGKIPLLVGGTMMYFKALQQGLAILPPADDAIRNRINREAEAKGWPFLHARLAMVDADAAHRIHPHDSQRIQRALEVYELTGKSLSAWQQENTKELSAYHIINIAVTPNDRAVLHARIAQRFQQMIKQGFVEEVRSLYQRGDLTINMPSIRSVGYRQVWEYLQGNYQFDEMCEKAIIATRQLAKRQLTWLRHWDMEVKWFDSMYANITDSVVSFLKQNIEMH
jgi:tRNA dimethylallyltransferase